MRTLTREDFCLTWSPTVSSKEAALQVVIPLAIPDPRARNNLCEPCSCPLNLLLGVKLCPWILVRPYLFLSTLSRSTSWPPFTRGEERHWERERRVLRRRDVHVIAWFSHCISALWQRPFGSFLIYISALLHSIWPSPKIRHCTHKKVHKSIYHVFFQQFKLLGWRSEGWIQGIVIGMQTRYRLTKNIKYTV